MAAETLRPDGQLSCSGLVTCDFLEHDDDPDVSSVTIDATGNNVSTEYGVDFPTPSGNPTAGADLQEFRAGVIEFDAAQTGTPKARIELWENGALVRAGADTNVSVYAILGFTWNASELATADGSLVQCKVIGTRTGGGPGKRNTVRIGHIEWNAEVDVAAVTGDGSSDGTSTATGDGVSTAAADGASAGAATATGDGASAFVADGSSAGAATITGEGASTFAGDGSAAGLAAVTAVGQDAGNIQAGDGSSAGVAGVSADGISTFRADGVSAGAATATGDATSKAAADGSATGAATVTGGGASKAAADGSSDGAATASGGGVSTFRADGVSAGAATATGGGVSTAAAPGTSVGIATVIADGASKAAGAGSSTGLAGTTAVPAVSGSSAGIATATGDGASTAMADASAAGAAAVTAVGHEAGTGAGVSSGVTTVTGAGAFTERFTDVGEHPDDIFIVVPMVDEMNFDLSLKIHVISVGAEIVDVIHVVSPIPGPAIEINAAMSSSDIELKLAA